MSMKYLIIGLLLLCLVSFVSADTITNYIVPANAPLNQPITATGLYTPTTGEASGEICSFYFFESNGNVIYRATDQYTTVTGRFAMNGVSLVEPRFVRGQTYTLHSECGTATADANFSVSQKQEAVNIMGVSVYPQGAFMDLMYFNGDNGFMLFVFLIIAMFFVGLLVLWVGNFF